MRIVFITLLLLISATGFSKYSCEGDCRANCNTWSIEYTVDCNGDIDTYTSVHTYPDGTQVTRNELNNPGYVGMNPTDLGCATNVCV